MSAADYGSAQLCEQVREDLSAALDDEAPGELAPWKLDHLAGCEACRAFQERAAAITRQMRVRALEDVPDLTEQILSAIAGDQSRESQRHRVPRVASLLTRCAAALIPFGLAISGLSSGTFAKAHVVPTRPTTPCTAALVHHVALPLPQQAVR